MTDAIRHLGATDPGLLFVIGLFFGAVFGMTLMALCFEWSKGGAS